MDAVGVVTESQRFLVRGAERINGHTAIHRVNDEVHVSLITVSKRKVGVNQAADMLRYRTSFPETSITNGGERAFLNNHAVE
jgi:hypothetical protein